MILVLALGFLLMTGIVSAAEKETCTKSFNLVLELTPSGTEVRAVQIVFGSSPHPADAPGSLRAVVKAADRSILSEFPLWDTRIQFGDEFIVDEEGSISEVRGIRTTESHATLAVMFPYSMEAATFELYDDQNRLIGSVPLAGAEDRATWNCTPDYGIPARQDGGGMPEIPVAMIVPGILALLCAGGVVWFFHKKRGGVEKP
jgi:hypothetical protein